MFLIINWELISIPHFNVSDRLPLTFIIPLELVVVMSMPWVLIVPWSVLALEIIIIPLIEVGVSIVRH